MQGILTSSVTAAPETLPTAWFPLHAPWSLQSGGSSLLDKESPKEHHAHSERETLWYVLVGAHACTGAPGLCELRVHRPFDHLLCSQGLPCDPAFNQGPMGLPASTPIVLPQHTIGIHLFQVVATHGPC